MKTLYLDLGMGAAGDMLTGALLELFPDPQMMLDRLNALGLPGVVYRAEKAEKCGITGTHMAVLIDGVQEEADGHDHCHHHDHAHEHHGHAHVHHGMADIEHIVQEHLALPEEVRRDVLEVFGLIAQAESHVHGAPVNEIHFHEVGTMDSVADVTAVCFLMRELAVDEVAASPVHVGSGTVKCAHGILSVPAPATAFILQGIPAYGGRVQGELCTPTGAALLKRFVTRFGDMPVMKTTAIGYGMGTKDFERANCVRAFVGETQGSADSVAELSCNVDDMTPEAVGYCMEKLLAGGAVEVYTVPVGMKKNRPGTLIRALCRPEDRAKVVELLFRHTTTIGVRETAYSRHVLDRREESVDTPYGPIRRKVSTGYGVRRVKYEHDDLARLADAQGISLQEARALVEQCEK